MKKSRFSEEQVADLGVTELRRLKMLEDESSRLKRIVADLTLDTSPCRSGASNVAQ